MIRKVIVPIFRAFIWKGIIISVFLSLQFLPVQAQSLAVGVYVFEDYYRRSQLNGQLSPSVSFTLRPLFLSEILKRDSSINDSLSRIDFFLYKSVGQKNSLEVLPVLWQQKFDGNPVHSWNDGIMVPAKGYQTMISGGAFATFGPLSLQLRPEFVFAANNNYVTRKLYFGSADLPSRFGEKPYSRLSWGQSNVRLTFDPVSIGLSNENLWWGPGTSSSLLMSNTAPGFKHMTLNTSRPVRTFLGSFEAQVVAGRLEGSDFKQALPDDWRYLSGLVFTYQPKLIPGFFLGLTRSFQIYKGDMDGSFGDYFPFFQPFQKIKTNEGNKRRDQLTSIFSRILMPASKAEVYFEYGLNDHSYNIRDFLMAPEHSRAYILGMKKLIPFRHRPDEFIDFNAEFTHLEQSIDHTIRNAGEWYTHHEVIHGYTNRGEVLGAGIGPGGNLQFLSIAWFKGLKQLGIQFARYEHNGDMAAWGFSPWIDFSIAAVADWTYNKFLINAKLQGIQSINYQWKDGINGRPKQNIFNINAQLGIMYSF